MKVTAIKSTTISHQTQHILIRHNNIHGRMNIFYQRPLHTCMCSGKFISSVYAVHASQELVFDLTSTSLWHQLTYTASTLMPHRYLVILRWITRPPTYQSMSANLPGPVVQTNAFHVPTTVPSYDTTPAQPNGLSEPVQLTGFFIWPRPQYTLSGTKGCIQTC